VAILEAPLFKVAPQLRGALELFVDFRDGRLQLLDLKGRLVAADRK
jgi:hypothetical protein